MAEARPELIENPSGEDSDSSGADAEAMHDAVVRISKEMEIMLKQGAAKIAAAVIKRRHLRDLNDRLNCIRDEIMKKQEDAAKIEQEIEAENWCPAPKAPAPEHDQVKQEKEAELSEDLSATFQTISVSSNSSSDPVADIAEVGCEFDIHRLRQRMLDFYSITDANYERADFLNIPPAASKKVTEFLDVINEWCERREYPK